MEDDFYCDSVLNGRVSVQVVEETDNVLAFHHVFQAWDTHIVVIPKKHVRSLVDVDDPSLLAEVFQVVVQVIKKHRFDESNYKVITNGGTYQSNKHLHVHVVSGKPLSPEHPGARGELAVC
jgi:histidine triad (HIT) family protein